MSLPDLRARLRVRRVNTAALAVVVIIGLAGAGLVGLGVADRDDGRDGAARVTVGDPTAAVTPAAAAVGPTPSPVSTSVSPGPSPSRRASKPAARERSDGDLPGLLPLTAAVAGQRLDPVSGRLVDVKQDAGMSVALPDGRKLWIFADTLQLGHRPGFFVTSSAAVSRRGSQRLTYLSNGGVKPLEFLRRTAAERSTQINGVSYTAIWPTGATALPDGRILISYAEYDVNVNPATFTLRGAGLYTYRYPGFARITRGGHATRAAELWSASDGAIGSPVYRDGYVYFTQCQSLECYSARTTVADLTSRSGYRWFTGSGWGPRADRAPMAYGSGRPGGNPSVTYLAGADVFATVSTSTGHTAQIGQLWVAPNPWGPWSAPKDYLLPGCPAAGCYALNLHPIESSAARVRISYATAGEGPYVHVTDVPVRIVRTAARASVS